MSRVPSFTGSPLAEKALRRACHRINPTISVHGMRSTFRDWAATTTFARELAELALANKPGDDTEAADALEKRRPMMEVWGRFCIPANAVQPR